MEIIIKGTPKEIAALVVGLQGQAISTDSVTEELAMHLREAVAGTFPSWPL